MNPIYYTCLTCGCLFGVHKRFVVDEECPKCGGDGEVTKTGESLVLANSVPDYELVMS